MKSVGIRIPWSLGGRHSEHRKGVDDIGAGTLERDVPPNGHTGRSPSISWPTRAHEHYIQLSRQRNGIPDPICQAQEHFDLSLGCRRPVAAYSSRPFAPRKTTEASVRIWIDFPLMGPRERYALFLSPDDQYTVQEK